MLPNDGVNKAVDEELHGRGFENMLLHEREATIRLRAERVGTIEALHYSEVEEPPLGDNRVEVEIEAAGMNFKDLAITMGIVPDNEHLLGLEGAGIIRRVSSTSYKVGDRVLVFENPGERVPGLAVQLARPRKHAARPARAHPLCDRRSGDRVHSALQAYRCRGLRHCRRLGKAQVSGRRVRYPGDEYLPFQNH